MLDKRKQVPSMPTLRFQVGATVTPGDRLGSLRELKPGSGTYARGGHVFSCSVGKLVLLKNHKTNDDDENATAASTIISVLPRQTTRGVATSQVLRVGQLVLCRVVRIQLQQVNVEIIAAEPAAPTTTTTTTTTRLFHKPQGQIRREDIRQNANSADQLVLESCYRPGDVILGRIVSLGDAHRYLVSTAETELGVVRACSSTTTTAKGSSFSLGDLPKEGIPMKAISWKEMECPVTGRKEPRKVAKPSPALKEILQGL